jgi:methionyl aminopeptidase
VRRVPPQIVRPDYVVTGRVPPPRLELLDDAALARLRRACAAAAAVLAEVGRRVAPGVTTDELDGLAHEAYLAHGAYPSTLHYKGYTKSICTSVNEVVCHGIPDSRPLREGDIVNVDVTAYLDGMHGDTSATFVVGDVDPPTLALVRAAREAMLAGIAAVRVGAPLADIAVAVENVADRYGLGVVEEWGGHGIGRMFHADPHISHVAKNAVRMDILPGMSFTVEPMLAAGSARIAGWPDGWTVVTADGLPSAQFEHTVYVTANGPEILTLEPAGDADR